jgi:hypothetical protein
MWRSLLLAQARRETWLIAFFFAARPALWRRTKISSEVRVAPIEPPSKAPAMNTPCST